jgi:predicted esterase
VVPVAASLPRVLLGRGTTDAWYTADKAAKDLAALRQAGVDVVEHVFEGGHAWDDAFILRAGEFVDELLSS